MPVGFQSERRARVPVQQGVQQVARQPAGSDDSRRTKAGPTILSAPRSTNGRESTHGPQRKGANRTCCVEFRQAARSAIRWASFQLAMCLEAVSPCRTGPTSIAVLRFDRRTTRLSGPDKRRDERQTLNAAETYRSSQDCRLLGSLLFIVFRRLRRELAFETAQSSLCLGEILAIKSP